MWFLDIFVTFSADTALALRRCVTATGKRCGCRPLWRDVRFAYLPGNDATWRAERIAPPAPPHKGMGLASASRGVPCLDYPLTIANDISRWQLAAAAPTCNTTDSVYGARLPLFYLHVTCTGTFGAAFTASGTLTRMGAPSAGSFFALPAGSAGRHLFTSSPAAPPPPLQACSGGRARAPPPCYL